MVFVVRRVLPQLLVAGLAGGLCAQTLTDIGPSAPNPGAIDIDQLSTAGNQTGPDGLNYYTDNQRSYGSGEPGQKFTTGTNAAGYLLTSVAVRTGGLGSFSGLSTPQPYYLHLYSVSGSTAQVLQTYTSSNFTFNDGEWLKWSGFSVRLLPNAAYAFSFGQASSTNSWEAMAVATNAYAGGEIALIPPAGGTFSTGSSHKFDAVFDLGLQPGPTNIPASVPWPMPTYGWNLGDTLEATWGVPAVSAAPFYTAANAGLNAVRIPCAWDFNATTNIAGHSTNYPINPAYMAQVKQAVDWAIASGMYVMINDHWDDGWLENNIGATVDATINAKMNSYWTQIAATFAGYDNHLLFAGANEPNVSSPAEMQTLMFYYQTFVNAVRGVGGNNTNRWLVLQNVADPSWFNALPTDSVSNRLMVEYHCYSPAQFAILSSDASWGMAQYFWGQAYHDPADPGRDCVAPEEGAIDSGFQQLAGQYVSAGIPVMVGEFGAAAKPGLAATNAAESAWNVASEYYWHKYVAESARAHGLSPFFWSTPGSPFDWTSGSVNDAQIISVLTGVNAPPPPNGAPDAPSGLAATVNNSNVVLTWTPARGATSYNLYRAAESGEEGTNPIVTGLTGTSYTNTSLESGMTYYFQVVGANPSGLSGFSAEAHAAISGANPDPAQFNFETDPQRWQGGGGIISGVAASTAEHYTGHQSLAVSFNGSAAGTSSATVDNVEIAPGATITFHVWIPSGSKVTSLQAYLQDYNWNWSSSYDGSLTGNTWNTINLTVPAAATSPLQTLGIQFSTSAAWAGTCYLDSISWNTPAPDFILTANPNSLTLQGGSNGASTITVTASNALNGVYTLSASHLPAGVTATFATNPSTGGANTLTLTVSANAPSSSTNVSIASTCGWISHTNAINLTVISTVPPNTPPVLGALANDIVNVGQSVAFTASASDTDQPPQTLTFALLSGPTNALLNSGTGAFSFRPLVSQANSTNNFVLKVSDNGTPSLSATQSFFVVVNPLVSPSVSNVSMAGGTFSFNINGQSGPDYALESSTDFMQWTNIFITNSPVVPFLWTDTYYGVPQRFYRVKIGPPLP